MSYGPFAKTLVLAALTLSPLVAQKSDSDPAKLRAIARAAIQSGNFVEAEDAAAKALAISEKDAVAWYQIGYARHAQKKYDSALEAHMRAASFDDNPQVKVLGTYNAACIFAIRNEKDEAFKWLGKAVKAGFNQLGTLKNDTDMDNLRDDPRFAKIVAAVDAAAGAQPSRAFPSTSARKNSRIAYFGARGSTGQFAIDYSPVPWKDQYKGILDSEKFVGQRWRLGSNFWTNLDTNVPLTIGGESFQPGLYYLMVTHKGDRKMVLTVMPAAKVRKARLDASAAASTTGGIDVPMKHKESDDVAENLSINAVMDNSDDTNGTLIIRFGPHVLTTSIQTHLDKQADKKKAGKKDKKKAYEAEEHAEQGQDKKDSGKKASKKKSKSGY